jgi:hypothetical protein
MIWKVNYTENAEQDLQSIFDYISDVLLEPVTVSAALPLRFSSMNLPNSPAMYLMLLSITSVYATPLICVLL